MSPEPRHAPVARLDVRVKRWRGRGQQRNIFKLQPSDDSPLETPARWAQRRGIASACFRKPKQQWFVLERAARAFRTSSCDPIRWVDEKSLLNGNDPCVNVRIDKLYNTLVTNCRDAPYQNS